MTFVLDSSVALSWCFEDERTDAGDETLRRVATSGAVAPVLWPLEVLNGLAMAERRRRLDSATRQRFAGFLRDLPVSIDTEAPALAWDVIAELAARFHLTVYDAAYLELARRLALPLATLDQDLRMAARQLGVSLLGMPGDVFPD
ncbi:MAG: type II toxin-antitoxin system VapC family toxin [Burkholderiaceae bacterium]|nr:type II toxin-antitoxin system VapC family toxin [Burkholderiaceae bacterium]